MNNQKPSKRFDDPDGRLKVNEIFGSIQGEGPHSGLPATFIRLSGCNLQCPNCDTKYTSYETKHVHSIVTAVRLLSNKLVVITGGEPFLQNIGRLIARLYDQGNRVQIETNGSLAPTERCKVWLTGLDIDIVVSPKTPKLSDFFLERGTAFKYVIPGDGPLGALPEAVLGHQKVGLAHPPKGFNPAQVYMQPEDGANQIMACSNMLEISKRYGYRCGVQLHKLLDVR